MSCFPGLQCLFPNHFPVNFIKLQYPHTCVNEEQSALILKIFLILFQNKFSQSGRTMYFCFTFFHQHWGNELLHCNCHLEMLFYGSLTLLCLPNLRWQYVVQNNFYSQVISMQAFKKNPHFAAVFLGQAQLLNLAPESSYVFSCFSKLEFRFNEMQEMGRSLTGQSSSVLTNFLVFGYNLYEGSILSVSEGICK